VSGTYEDLTGWQKAIQLVLFIYSVTKRFPQDEIYGLTAQLRRAAVSIASNIAEGKGRSSDRDLLHFLSMARGSLFEVKTQLVIASELGYIDAESMKLASAKIAQLGRLLNGLMNSVRARLNKSTAKPSSLVEDCSS
jgi:four helix bundle protein